LRSAFVFCAIIATMLFPTSSFAEHKVTVTKDAVVVQAPGGAYFYFLKEKQAEFLVGIKINDTPGVARVILDKDDKPLHILVATKNKDGKYDINHLPKNDPKNAQLYKETEEHIAKFVKENGVKKILKKYKK